MSRWCMSMVELDDHDDDEEARRRSPPPTTRPPARSPHIILFVQARGGGGGGGGGACLKLRCFFSRLVRFSNWRIFSMGLRDVGEFRILCPARLLRLAFSELLLKLQNSG
jgi:hypothetical protein